VTPLAPRLSASKRLKYVVALRRSRVEGTQDDRPYIGLENIESSTGRLIGDPAATDQPAPSATVEAESLSNTFEPGDVLFGKLRPYLAKAWVAAFPGRCTTELLVMQPVETESRFLRYVCLSRDFIDAVDASTFGSKMPRADWDFIGNMPVPVPRIPQQRAIADYLDRETARLDALVTAKERVLGLLAEQRRTLITHAVTRGLDPRAPLRDSGILWLGEIPAHWEIKRLKHISPFITVGVVVNPSSYVTPEGVPFLYGSDVTEEGIKLESVRRVPPEVSRGELAKTCLKAGDIVTVRVGAPGITAVVPPELDGANCASIMLVRGAASFDSQWFSYAMNSDVGRHQVALVQYGAAQEQFNISHAVDFSFAVPPINEQRKIVSYVHNATTALDALRSAITRTIDLLKERRAALIAAAVTGQIYVESAT
jgi:type I restriction enzyme, S subunit